MSRLLTIPKHRRELVGITEDGSAKTFIYKDLDEKPKASPWARVFNITLRRSLSKLRSRKR